MNKRALTLLIVAAQLTAAGRVCALSFGDVNVQSQLGEPLKAEVEIIESFNGEAGRDLDIHVMGASGDKVGPRESAKLIERLKFTAYRRHDARLFLNILSDDPIAESQFSLILDAQAGATNTSKTLNFQLRAKNETGMSPLNEKPAQNILDTPAAQNILGTPEFESAAASGGGSALKGDVPNSQAGISANETQRSAHAVKIVGDAGATGGIQPQSTEPTASYSRTMSVAIRDPQLAEAAEVGPRATPPSPDAPPSGALDVGAQAATWGDAATAQDLNMGDLFARDANRTARLEPVIENSASVSTNTADTKGKQAVGGGLVKEHGPSSPGSTVLVRKGQSLKRVARKVKHPAVSLDQMMVALFQANPKAFNGGNLLRIKRGSRLQVPDAATVLAVEAKEATQIVRAHSKDFAAYRLALAERPNAVSRTKENKLGAGGAIKSQVKEEKKTEFPDRLALSRAHAKKDVAADTIAKRRQGAETRARAKERAANLRELAQVQKDLGALNVHSTSRTALATTVAAKNGELALARATKSEQAQGVVSAAATDAVAFTGATTVLRLPGIASQEPKPIPAAPLAGDAANRTRVDASAAESTEVDWMKWLSNNILILGGAVILVLAALMFFSRRRER